MKHSIVIVTWNAIEHVVRCIDSVLKNSEDFELIVVDNGSTDGVVGYLKGLSDDLQEATPGESSYLKGKIKRYEKEISFKIILNKENRNFGPANNQGYAVAEGEVIVLLNSDTIVTKAWLEKMGEVMASEKKAAIIGCMSNSSNGRQMVLGVHSSYQDLEHNAAAWAQKNYGKRFEVGIIYGWCMMISREFLKDEPYLFDDQFVNSYEDNDLCLRARLKGWRLVIDQGTYIFHAGQGSFQKGWGKDFLKNYTQNGRDNEDRFFSKWKPAEEQKLIAVYRIANCQDYVRESLKRTSEFADEIICLLARSSDRTEEIARSFSKVKVVEVWTEPEHPFDEQAERNWLLQKAIERGATWVISVDGDEIYEKKFVDMVPKLIRNSNPQIFGYWCNWRTIWDREEQPGGTFIEKFRSDGIFGGFQNYRFHKVIPGMEIKTNDNIYNHHCGSAPFIPAENLSWLNVRVKHLGYDSIQQRQKKYHFYRTQDPHALAKDVGNADYHHLIDRNVQVKTYREDNGLTLMTVVKNEEEHIHNMLRNVEQIVDEYVIVDNGSTDGTLAEIERFKKWSIRPVRVIQKEFAKDENGMLMNYSAAKNFGKSLCRTEWILQMDADELFKLQDVTKIFGFLDEDIDGLLFKVCNYMTPPVSENIDDPRNKFSMSEAIRLYRNIKSLFYSGLIHESLEDCARARMKVGKGSTLLAPIVLHHRGYLRAKNRLREKFDRYAKINMMQFKQSGEKDPRPLFNLALHAQNEGDDLLAMKYYKECIALSPNFWRANQGLAYYHLDRAKELLGKALAQVPDNFKAGSKIGEIYEVLEKNSFKIHKMAVD